MTSRPGRRRSSAIASLLFQCASDARIIRVIALLALSSCRPAEAPLRTGQPYTKSGDVAGPAARPPNIVFILVDTLRADHLGTHGRADAQTPVIDALAAEGVVFERANATAPWTLPSVASLFTGVYPGVHDATQYELGPSRGESGMEVAGVSTLNEAFDTLAEQLQHAGYATAACSANPFIVERNGFAQGFEHFDSSFAANTTPGGVVNDAAERWLRQRDPTRPFFLYLHYMDVHAPYRVRPETLAGPLLTLDQQPDKRGLTRAELTGHPGYFAKTRQLYLRDPLHEQNAQYAEYYQCLYAGCVREMDHWLSELRQRLDALGIWRDALIIFTADHGEALGEHRIWTHGLSAHQNQLHVPMIVRWPGQVPAGRRVPAVVRLFDLMPTVLELAGAPLPQGLQAESLVALLREDSPAADRLAFAEAVKQDSSQRAVIVGEWKLLVSRQHPDGQLFHLREDPQEQRDLAAQHSERVTALRARLDQQTAANADHPRPTAQSQRAPLTPAEVQRLRALGYGGADDEEPDSGP